MAKKKDKDKIKTTKEHHSLKCMLTDAELLRHGDELATALDNLRSLAEEKESVVKGFKAREAVLDATIANQQLLVRNKYEYRVTDCELELNYTEQVAKVTRLDLGTVVRERKLTEEEKQMDLGFDKEGEDEAA